MHLSNYLLTGKQFHRLLNPTLIRMTSTVAGQTAKTPGPVESAIRSAIRSELSPIRLEVLNESYMHNVPKGSESHFKLLIVSNQFENLSLIKRHRLVNDIVKRSLDGCFVHALSIIAKTPSQYDEEESVEPSPNCRGGFGK